MDKALRNLKTAARTAITYLESYERDGYIPSDSVHQPRMVITKLKRAVERSDAKESSAVPTKSDPRMCL